MSTAPGAGPISYPITLPFTAFQRSSFTLDRYESAQESLLSRHVQTVSIGAGTLDRWHGVLQTPALTRGEARMWRAFFDALRGVEGCFTLSDPGWDGAPAATVSHVQASGSPTVQGAVTPRSFNLQGLPGSTPGALRAGDYIRVGDELKRLVVSADSNAGGIATLIFEPGFRILPPVGAPVEVIAPTLTARLEADPPLIEFGVRVETLAFNWVEVFA